MKARASTADKLHTTQVRAENLQMVATVKIVCAIQRLALTQAKHAGDVSPSAISPE
jgi:hypothetical protein